MPVQSIIYALSGQKLVSLMRRHHITIRGLSKITQITQKQIREVRKSGLADRNAARDWVEHITGVDPGLRSIY